jgi:excisionase family DNA binding protein
MAQKYYNVKEAAQMLGLTEESVRQMQERRELYGYRDGADWKFKAEDIERMAKERPAGAAAPAPKVEDSSEDVLVTEVQLGQSGIGASGTVIGMEGPPRPTDSDIFFADSNINIISPSTATPPPIKNKNAVDSQVAKFEDLDLGLEDDLTLAESGLALDAEKKPTADSPTGGSELKLSAPAQDDDMVIGGSSGSGVTLAGDSGISLVDPADSGLSLEEPLELSGGSGSGESLELGEDDMLQIVESSKSLPDLKADDDFLLTPTEEIVEADDSDSDSQVIALDTESDDNATMVSAPQGMAAMLDEDLMQPALGLGAGTPLGRTPLGVGGMGMQAALAEAGAVHPGAFAIEAPYSGLNITGLIFCVVFLMLCGMLIFDLLRNM